MSIFQFSLSKVSCAGCVRSIERSLQSQDQIQDFSINFADRSASIETSLTPSAVISVIESAGYGASLIEDDTDLVKRDQDAAKELKQSFVKAFVALALGALLMAQMLLGWMPDLSGVAGQLMGLATGLATLIVMRYSAGHIYRGAWSSAKRLNFNMDTLIALGTGSAWIYSSVLLVAIFFDLYPIPPQAEHLYYEAAVMIIGFILLGQALEAKGRGQTASALRELMNLQPKRAMRIRNGEERLVAIALLSLGDQVRIRPGEQVPIDGRVVEGESYVDESMLTGESMPVKKSVGMDLTGGTQNGQGSLLAEVVQVGRQTRLAQIMRSVRDAQNTKPQIGRFADKVSAVFVPVVMLIALITLVFWSIWGPDPRWSLSVIASVTVLIVACPCALGLATPMSVMVGVGRAARMGILIRNGEALQQSENLTTLVIDKTGTLTEGKPKITNQFFPEDSDRALSITSALAGRSEHPLSEALAKQITDANRLQVEQFESQSGSGVSGVIDGISYRLGNQTWIEQGGVNIEPYKATADEFAEQGCSLVWLASEGGVLALFGLRDQLRADSRAAIERFKSAGLAVVLLSGDNRATVKAIALEAGISEIKAEVSPEEKQQYIAALQSEGKVVAMVGDGVNDAPALAQADVGFAMGSGTDIAIGSADVALMQNSLNAVADGILLSRATVKNIKQNLFGAFVYNTLAIPVAAGVLYPAFGLLLNPMIAGAAMALSSVTVVANARRLNRLALSS